MTMRIRRRYRRQLTPHQIVLTKAVRRATTRARIMAAGAAAQLEKLWDIEEFEIVQEFINSDLAEAFSEQKRAETEFEKSENPPRTSKKKTAPKARPNKKGTP